MTGPVSSVEGDIEDYIVRYSRIEEYLSPFRTRDMQLPRFERERYSIVGRPGENAKQQKGNENKHFSIVLVRAEPGKGFALHAHDTTEVFVVLAGSWECQVADRKSVVEPFDVINVPDGVFHSLKNCGEGTAIALAINAGNEGAPIRLAPEILAELRQIGVDVLSDREVPPVR